MGYESKIFVVDRLAISKNIKGEPINPPIVSALIVASYDLCDMGGEKWAAEFYAAFKKEIDYTLYVPSVDDEGKEVVEGRNTDMYGDHMKAATLDDLIRALTICERREHYRRIPPLIALLSALSADKEEWGELQAVHYGH